jgi:1-acyl-sn-glycerol-3-phosphate acyltransferase
VSNHIAFIETLYFGWRAFPSFVAKSDVMKYPIVGTIGKGVYFFFFEGR